MTELFRSRCPLCKSQLTIMHENIQDYYFRFNGSWDMYKCNNPLCGILLPNPQPTDDQLRGAYSNYYTHTSGSQGVFKLKLLFMLSEVLKICFSNFMIRKRLNNIPFISQFLEKFLLAYSVFKPFGNRRVADIGCGSGDRLPLLTALGWLEAVGVDPDLNAVTNGRKLNRILKLGFAEQLPLEDDYFDAVILHHVIEHVRDPYVVFKELFRVLRVGGSVILLTPNVMSKNHDLYKKYWRGLEAPRHLIVYSLDSLVCVLQLSGFKVVMSRSSARGSRWMSQISNQVMSKEMKVASKLSSAYHSDVDFREQMKCIQNGSQIGDEIFIIAKKYKS